jgi:SAM-dependent methyltransferase
MLRRRSRAGTNPYLSRDATETGDFVWGVGEIPRTSIALNLALEALCEIGGKVIEVGCGTGRFIRSIKASRPDLDAVGCDKMAEAIDYARREGSDIAYAVADVEALPFPPATFEAVVFFDLLEHLTRPGRAIEGAHRILRPRGLLHGMVPCEGQPGTLHWAMWRLGVLGDLKERHAGHVQRFTHTAVRQLIEQKGFDIVRITYSMHFTGQLRDVIVYLIEEDRLRRVAVLRGAMRLVAKALGPLSRLEFLALRRVPVNALNMHISAIRQV